MRFAVRSHKNCVCFKWLEKIGANVKHLGHCHAMVVPTLAPARWKGPSGPMARFISCGRWVHMPPRSFISAPAAIKIFRPASPTSWPGHEILDVGQRIDVIGIRDAGSVDKLKKHRPKAVEVLGSRFGELEEYSASILGVHEVDASPAGATLGLGIEQANALLLQVR
ncbi:hypothetical protein CPPEL_06760 [Corynebacterium pseudopelargi]|uniref:Uncharacterized protein n=1 Tax=Corynebacterium pseudopelargi TaxID=2080757 RepID=A0A3G6IV60_9CORY|nr:hypothetical protein CPPEL_06760 [Corynebacterium pseudopelargi]